MADDRFDCCIVGGGIAGCVAAYLLARAGLETVLIERGNFPGAKNMTGGRLYSHSLDAVMPGFAQEAPVERQITNERIAFLTDEAQLCVEFSSPQLAQQGSDSYSILSSTFDAWLAERAEDAGAQIVAGIRVDELIMRDGAVCGVVAGGEELEARVTLLADGANSPLAVRAGLRKEFAPTQVAVGVKELIELPAKVIEDRFACDEGTGTAALFVGSPTAGGIGGGFLYTNRESISLGIVATLSTLVAGQRSVPAMLEAFKQHPRVAPLIKGGKLLEYSGHAILEGGYDMIPQLAGDGLLVCGDAAGLCQNLGYQVRGLDFAVASARFAAETIIEALSADDSTREGLAGYKRRLEESFVLRDLHLHRTFPQFLESTPRMFDVYPQLAVDICNKMFVVDGTPARHLKDTVKPYIGNVGLFSLLKDVKRGVDAL